ncbi:DUF429 domain-containing protein [Oxynema aestuarii]|uniref:DUF429 domain-containing protein n=1 Tax=Oxynema aestuarii AP17 TaxID=2064643 RepID=A0A6H1U104_9CYAN|nr:DUF429 domain-containing protein [Oxynema aestuarii]QIZ72335.1 DUF429 domain-containing protein [Oxynema aestuarii AP17]
MKFLGVDLGWSSGESGLCCLVWRSDRLYLDSSECQLDLDDIFAWIEAIAPRPQTALVAVDAPTVIPNATRMREADKLTHKYFGRYHAGCYPANLNSRFAARTVGFGCRLEACGFAHAAQIEPKKPGRYQIEVFPHPATIALFGLERILKYKKGKLGDRKPELMKLRQYIVDRLPQLEPRLSLDTDCDLLRLKTADFNAEVESFKGKQLKALEDRLDALLCAYIGAYWWYWGRDRTWVFGDRDSGYIVIPAIVN